MKSKLTMKDMGTIAELRKNGKTEKEIAEIYNVSQGTISRNLKYYGYELEVKRVRSLK